ncbi:MAG: hypothetical protein KGH53_00770 [Candidatus Micrarchaeota archaeon]|nr:hypothetical protein [Candidatus Micrarchaeota archaeon]
MQKAIIAYIAIFIVLLIFVFYTYSAPKQKAPTTTTVVVTTVNGVVSSTTIPQTISTTTTIPQGSCLSSQSSIPVYNGDFATGTYVGWNQTTGAFGSVPVNITYANSANVMGYYNHTWVNYLGNFFASTFHGGLGVQPGNLTSLPLKVVEPYINFRIISPLNNLLYVEVLQGGNVMVSTHYNTYVQGNPYPTSQFLNASLPVSSLLCQNVTIRVVAQVVGSYTASRTYIAVGDFYQSKTPVVNPGISNPSQIVVNQTIKGVNG